MSLLSICQAAASTAPVAVPTSIVGNSDETAILLLNLANDAGDELARRPPGGWVSMIREYDFATAATAAQPGSITNVGGVGVISGLTNTGPIQPYLWTATGDQVPNNAIITAVTSSTVTINLPANGTSTGSFTFGQADYPLPADFERAVDNTFWDRTRYWQMRGPMSPQDWQMFKSSVIGQASIQRRYRFRSIRNSSGNPASLPRGVYLSIDPLPTDNGAQLVFEYVSNGWCESASGTPQSEWMADTDVGIVSEYQLRLSLKYRLLRRLGLSYSEELDEYERQVEKAVATDGASPILNMTPLGGLSYLGPWNVQEGGYPGPDIGFGFGSSGTGGFGTGPF